MTYTIEYKKPRDPNINFERHVRRILTESVTGWLLKDGNGKNIRKFPDLGSAMQWIDEERRGS